MENQEIINQVNIRPKSVGTEIIDEAKLSTCKIEIDNESGTGFFLNLTDKIGKNCLITNYHVISKEYVDQKKTIRVKLKNGGADIILDRAQRYIKFFEDLFDHDIIIIEILESDNLNNKVKFLNYNRKFIHGYRQYIGQDIFIIGYPLDSSKPQFNLGKITNLRGTFEFEHYLDTDNGSSGSPILSYDNTLIGLHRGRYRDTDKKVGIFIGEIIVLLRKELESAINRDISNYNESNLHDKIDELSSNVQDFYQSYYNNNIKNNLTYLFNLLRKTLEDFKYLFILVLGGNKIANLNILNGLIEFEILPGECQNKNIIIKPCQNDDISLRKIKFKSENSLDFNGDKIGIGFDQIQNILIKDPKNIKDKEEFIYELDINIKFVEKNIKGQLKEKLCFINLPNPSLIPNISKYLIENSEIFLYVVDYANNLYNNLKFIEKYYIDIYKDSFQKQKEIIQKKIIKNSLILINYKKEQEISQETFKEIEIVLNKYTGELTKEKDAKLEYRVLNIDFYEKKMIKYFEELEAFIQIEYNRYRLSLENNLENKKITFDEYILNELNNYITNYGSSESSESNRGDNIANSLRNDLESIYEIKNNELDSIIKKFISMNQYFSKEQDFQNKINLFIDKFKIIVLESNIEANKVFKQKIQNYNKEIDNIIVANEEEPKKKKLEELENIFKKLKSKQDQIIKYMDVDFESVIKILENAKNDILNYNLTNKKDYEYFKKTIKNDLRQKLNNLKKNLDDKIGELSKQSKEYYKDFYKLLSEIEELKNNNDFLTFNQFINDNFYRDKIYGAKTYEITSISRNIDEETRNANSINYVGEVNGFLSYLFAKIDSIQYSQNIEKYLKKICSEKIDNVINSFNLDNDTYCRNIKNKIDILLNDAKSIIEGKKNVINEEIERDKTKKEKWEKIKINLNSF